MAVVSGKGGRGSHSQDYERRYLTHEGRGSWCRGSLGHCKPGVSHKQELAEVR